MSRMKNLGLMIGLASMCASLSAQSNQRIEYNSKMSIPRTTYKNKKNKKRKK